MPIAVVSHAGDDHAAAVGAALSGLGHRPVLIDTGLYPQGAFLSCDLGDETRALRLEVDGREIDLDDLEVIWWRRPQPYTLDPALDPAAAAFAYSECHEALAGLWHSLDAQWVNPPAADEIAHHKPLQLALAREVGLPIPRTLITSDPARARRFIAERPLEGTIFKTFLASDTHWRETRILHRDDVAKLDDVRLAPVIFQEFVPAIADLRVTIFGDEVRAVEILSAPDGYAYDYRVDLDQVTMRPAALPDEVTGALLRLMRRLDLVYGAIDLRRTPEGEHVFLEINPAGEFLFVEERSGEDLTLAMANLLCRLASGARAAEAARKWVSA